MSKPVTRTQTLASVATIILAAIAAVAGLSVPGLYRDPAVLLPQVYGQDLLTLTIGVPVLTTALYFARQGSVRARMVWLGVTAYILYTYASYAFMTAFNELYLLYTTLLWLSLYTLVSGLTTIDADRLASDFRTQRVWPYIVFEVLLALLVGVLWLSEIVPAILAGTTPPSIDATGIPVNVIHSLDLGIILPGFLLTAYLLWHRRPWGYVFTGLLLVKGATLGAAILAMAAWMSMSGQTVPLPQLVIFSMITLTAFALLACFLRTIDASA